MNLIESPLAAGDEEGAEPVEAAAAEPDDAAAGFALEAEVALALPLADAPLEAGLELESGFAWFPSPQPSARAPVRAVADIQTSALFKLFMGPPYETRWGAPS
jgi:hypothetical protein